MTDILCNWQDYEVGCGPNSPFFGAYNRALDTQKGGLKSRPRPITLHILLDTSILHGKIEA